MKKENEIKEDENVILTEEMLSENIAKSNEDFINSVEKQEKKKSRKKPLMSSHNNEEKLDTNFSITSIEPKTKGNYISNNETFVIKTSVANEEIVRNHLYVEPAVNYEIKEINSKEYEVALKNVPSDTLVNLSLVKDEVKSYSWAFQSTKE